MEDRIKVIYDFISDFWKIIKKYAELPDNDDEWEHLIYEAGELDKKYNKAGGSPESRLFTRLIVDWMEYLNEREKLRLKASDENISGGSRPP